MTVPIFPHGREPLLLSVIVVEFLGWNTSPLDYPDGNTEVGWRDTEGREVTMTSRDHVSTEEHTAAPRETKPFIARLTTVVLFGALLAVLLTNLAGPSDLFGLNLERLSNLNPLNDELLDVEHRDGYLLITAGLGGTALVDVTDPYNPQELDWYLDLQCAWDRLYNIFFGEQLIAGAGRSCPIPILTLTDNNKIQLISRHRTGLFDYEDVTISGDSLIVAAAHTNGIEVIDVSDPSFPVSLGSTPLDNAWAVRVEGSHAFVADGGAGLSIVDISDPSAPVVTGQLALEGSAKDVRVRNNYAFLALGDAGIAMIDVTDPETPFLVGQYNSSGLAAHLAVDDSIVAVADWDDIEILKYGPDGTLEVVGHKNSGGRVMGIDLADDLVYVAEWNLLQVYRFGQVAGADLDLDLVDIHFPRTEVGLSRDTTFVISNNGGSTLTIESIDISFTDFSLDVTAPLDIPPGQDLKVTLTYTPSVEDGQKEYITFSSNDTDEPSFRIGVWGNDIDLRVGDQAHNFTLPLLDGGEVTLFDLRGSVVVLSFFASW